MRATKTETSLRREQILEAALDLIGAEGVHHLSITAMAGRVGIVPSAIYRHFGGKDEVLDAVLDCIGKRLSENVRKARKESLSAPQRLRSLLMRHAYLLRENRAIPNVLFSDGLYAGHPARKKRVHDIVTGYLEEIERIFEEGVREGSIHPDISPGTGATLFLGALMPAAVLGNVVGIDIDVVAHAEKTWPILERSIVVDRPAAGSRIISRIDNGESP